MRRCVSAGEPLPQEIGRRWSARLGVDILDGIGSTEMLHIFLSNRPDEVRYGTTGKPLPGYPLKIVDEEGRPVRRGEVGDLLVSGPTSAALYWNNRERSRSTFNGLWTRTGDKYFENEDGYYVYCGRSDDMLKVSGMYVSPAEVEAALIAHEDVLEAAVVGAPDADGLIKPKAFVVVKPGTRADDDLARALEHHAKDDAGAVQMPALDRFSRRAAKDRDRQDPALQIARRQRALALPAPCREFGKGLPYVWLAGAAQLARSTAAGGCSRRRAAARLLSVCARIHSALTSRFLRRSSGPIGCGHASQLAMALQALMRGAIGRIHAGFRRESGNWLVSPRGAVPFFTPSEHAAQIRWRLSKPPLLGDAAYGTTRLSPLSAAAAKRHI